MFNSVAYRGADGSYKLYRYVGSKLDQAVYYESIDDLPDDIQPKVKQMLWVSPDDHSVTATLGVRVGDNTFWLF